MKRSLKYKALSHCFLAERLVIEGVLEETASEQARKFGIEIDYDKNDCINVGEGVIKDFPLPSGHKFPMVLGVSDLAVGMDEMSVVSNLAFAKGIVAACHEVLHAKQMMDQQSDMSDAGKEQSLCHLAMVGNPRFYEEYYVCNKREMLAEYMAMKSAESYLGRVFKAEETEQLLLEYIAWRTLPDNIKDGPDDTETEVVYPKYFIGPADTGDGYYEHLSDVKSAFEAALAADYPGQYCSRPCVRPAGNHKLRDEYVRVMEPNGRGDKKEISDKWSGIFKKFQDAGSQIESYRMLASLACYIHPEYKDSFGNLKDVDLTPETVFGMPFPEIPDEIRDRLVEEEAEVDAELARRAEADASQRKDQKRSFRDFLRGIVSHSERMTGEIEDVMGPGSDEIPVDLFRSGSTPEQPGGMSVSMAERLAEKQRLQDRARHGCYVSGQEREPSLEDLEHGIRTLADDVMSKAEQAGNDGRTGPGG